MLDWMTASLPSPADEKQPLILTDEQARFILDWYSLDDHGDRVYRRAILEMAKGWGKSPLAAALALAEFAGPVVFDGWDADGEPVGRPWGTGDSPPPIVQVAAVSEDQAENTYGAIYEMLVANEHRAAMNLGIDDGRTRLYLHDRPGHLMPVTASAGSREGQRLTFAVLDETHLWTNQNRGVALAATLRRNVAKMGGQTFETTNAPRIGDKSVAERSSGEAGRWPGILHYAKRPPAEPQPDWTDVQLLEALDTSYGDSYWIDRDRILKDVRDPATDWDDALRFFWNIPTAGTGRAVDPRRWDELAKPQEVEQGTYIGLGWDGSISQDASVLRACTADGYSFLIGAWTRPKGAVEWNVPRMEVHQAVAEAFARYEVGLMLCDPPLWQTEIDLWAEKYGDKRVLGFSTFVTTRFSPALDRWLTAIREGTHTHDGDPLTADHVKASHLKKVRVADAEDDGRTRYILQKGEDRRKIDAAVADVLAYEAAMTMPEQLIRKPRKMVTY